MEENKGFSLNAQELLKYQPNRYPLLMIDYVTEVIPGVSAKGYKYLTNNEWYFPVHYPGDPNMPGCLQLEALAQMLTVAMLTLPGLESEYVYALKHTIRYKREIHPGERFDIEAKVLTFKRGVCTGKVVGKVGEEVAVEADMMIAIPKIFNTFIPGRGNEPKKD